MPRPGDPRASDPGRGAGAVPRLEIREIGTSLEAELFLALPASLGSGWTIPLSWEARRLFDPAFNRFLDHYEVIRFLAWRDGRAVGRIAACSPRDGAGYATFGFLALERDAQVLRGMLGAAAAWLAARGHARMLGPLSFTINHEVGAQVSGQGQPPMLRMPRNPAWLPPMLDEAGLIRAKDVVACTLDVAREAHRARAAALLARRPEDAARLRLRRVRLTDWPAEVRRIADLYDDAWAENWGAVPLRPGEIQTMQRLLWPLALSGAIVFAEWEGEPIGLMALVPNLEEAMSSMRGRLLPFGWARLAGAIAGRVGSARIPLLGIRRAFRRHPASALAVAALLAEAISHAEARGWRRVEISWILEDNMAMRNAMARLPAPETGRWRIWEGDTSLLLGPA